MVAVPPGWTIRLFLDRFDDWVELESPPIDVRVVVLDWIMSRKVNPYDGVRREPDLPPNYWWGPIDGTQLVSTVVTCNYWVFEAEHVVQRDRFATLGLPV